MLRRQMRSRSYQELRVSYTSVTAHYSYTLNCRLCYLTSGTPGLTSASALAANPKRPSHTTKPGAWTGHTLGTVLPTAQVPQLHSSASGTAKHAIIVTCDFELISY